jgi:hypothetical protein
MSIAHAKRMLSHLERATVIAIAPRKRRGIENRIRVLQQEISRLEELLRTQWPFEGGLRAAPRSAMLQGKENENGSAYRRDDRS